MREYLEFYIDGWWQQPSQKDSRERGWQGFEEFLEIKAVLG